MYSTRFIIAVPVVTLSAALGISQDLERNQTVLLKEVHFSGELGESADELREYTEFLTGRRLERKKLLEDAASAVGKASPPSGLFQSAGDAAASVAQTFAGIKGCGRCAGINDQSWKAIPREGPDVRGARGPTGRGSAAPYPRNQEPDRHPQTARPRHTPARPTPNPTAKRKAPRTTRQPEAPAPTVTRSRIARPGRSETPATRTL
jgi:hypothetical protein